jgi:hypothetical protein
MDSITTLFRRMSDIGLGYTPNAVAPNLISHKANLTFHQHNNNVVLHAS